MNRLFSSILYTLYILLFLSISSINLHGQHQDSPVIITEFLASNDDLLLDKDGDSSDWIELFNKSDQTVSLEKWYLTDNPNNPFKWEFPKISLAPGEFLVVFASGKDLNNPDEELHTNFQLDSNGEFLALIERDKQTVASQFTPIYKPQQENTSYGLVQHVKSTPLVGEDSTAKLLIPSNNDLNLTWTGDPNHEPFSETNWKTVTSCIGYDKSESSISAINIAPLATASQSSEWGGFPASFANDGIDNNFTHTANGDLTPWLEFHFNTPQVFGGIILYNRTTCCQDRLYNITVDILDSNDAIIYTSQLLNAFEEGETPISPGDTISLNLLDSEPQGITGNKIRISKTPISGGVREYISLSEVQIFGIEQGYSHNITSNIETDMFNVNSTAYLRFPFNVEDENAFNALSLKMKYDDGFIAYINGIKVALKNAPNTTPINYNATANTIHLAELVELNAIPPNTLKQGQNILAIHGLNRSHDDLNFFIKPELEALQINTIPTQVYLNTPTPGSYNKSDGFHDITSATQFNFTRGFYDAPFELTISNNTPGATIIYTTDGSDPSEENGIKISPSSSTAIATANITIDQTTVIRTMSIKEFYKPTTIDTNTYIFIDDVIASEVMDKTITENPTYAPQMEEALTDLPTVSIAINPNTINNDTDEFASMEWILPHGESGFQENAGIKYFGGAFTDFDKKNFRLYFRSEYGASKLRFPLFTGHEHGIEPVSIFDQLELRAGSHDMVMRGFYMSNRFTDDTMLDMGNLNPHGQFVHLYINGIYWGQYHLRERWNADMHAQYLGGEKEDYEAINGNKNVGGWTLNDTPYDGDGSAWERVKSLRENYNEITPYLDVAHYIDYMIMYMYGNSENEYRCVGPTTEGSGFKFYLNDADGFLRNTGDRTAMDQPGQRHADGPASIFSMLFKEASPKFKILLADRIHKHFFNNGALTPEKIEERLLERCDQVKNSIIAESARWGYRTPESWETSKNDYLTDVTPFRTNTVINHFINAGFYPSIEAPQLSINGTQHYGGDIETGDLLNLTATYGDIYYTLDGSDPYIPGDNSKEELITLIEEDAQKTILVPTESLPSGWNSSVSFDDSSWISGTGSIGYERGNGLENIGIDVEDAMYNSQPSCLVRIPFEVDNAESINRLLLYLSYDDGAIVYLNGEEVVRVNAPSGIPLYNTEALSATEANALASFNISEHLSFLKNGTNIIAIHGMNSSVTSSDFYISTELVADVGTSTEQDISPSAIKYDGDNITLNETTIVKARALQYGEWSALSDANYLIETIDDTTDLKVKSSPNPFSDGINISFKSGIDTEATLEVYDALGRMVWHKTYMVEANTLSSTYIDALFWNNGLYIYKLNLSSGESFSGKLICDKNE